MQIKIHGFLFIVLFTSLLAGCNGQTTEAKKNKPQSNKQASANNNIDLQAPDFADPAVKKYYENYTAYTKKVVTAIRNKDEAGTMKLFTEGNIMGNNSKWEEKARSTPEEEQKFTTWLMQFLPYSKEIVQSDYYKKFSEAYYKNVKEKYKKMEEK